MRKIILRTIVLIFFIGNTILVISCQPVENNTRNESSHIEIVREDAKNAIIEYIVKIIPITNKPIKSSIILFFFLIFWEYCF